METLKLIKINGSEMSAEEISELIENLKENEMIQIQYKGEKNETE